VLMQSTSLHTIPPQRHAVSESPACDGLLDSHPLQEAWRLVTAFGSSDLSQEARIVGSAKRTVPNEGYPFPVCEMSVPLWLLLNMR